MQTPQIHTQSHTAPPLISFVVACYNLEALLLRQCIASITELPLTSSEREIILVDDGSDVSPLSELKDYESDLIYLRQHNQGLSVARNTGLHLARGRYIQFVDGDDCLLPPYRFCIELVRQQSPDMVMHQMTHQDSRQPSFQAQPPVSGAHYMAHHNLRATAWGYVFRRDLLGTLRFTPGILHEDEEFTPQLLLRAETLVETNAKAYLYRRREGSIVNNRAAEWIQKRLQDHHAIILRLRQLADRSPQKDKLALSRRIAQLTMDHLYNIITLTKDRQTFETQAKNLYDEGLLPLPKENYTRKYTWFRRLASTRIGRQLLFETLKRKSR